jgi:hypothetical protein
MCHRRQFTRSPPLVRGWLLVAFFGVSSGVAGEPPLLGCWRSQQVQLTFADHRTRDQNGDCVGEYEVARIHSRCRNGNTVTESVSVAEYPSPGHIFVAPLDGVTGKPATVPIEMEYRIDGDWLITTRRVGTQPGDPNKPERLTTLSVRVDKTREACQPRGDARLRIGRTPVSSLALSVPAGWEPWLVDPAGDRELAEAINTSFFIGAFVHKGALNASGRPESWLLVVDDVRYGPTPVRTPEFAGVRQRFARELGNAESTCDRTDRACAMLHLREGGAVYTELVNVRGRVAMISGVTSSHGGEEELRRNVRTFAEQLRRDNP